MREIKFRAWDKSKAKYWYDVLSEMGENDLYEDGERGEISMEMVGKCMERGYSSILIFEQYTGLKDKNGKEIYEGDILKTVWGDIPVEYGEYEYEENDGHSHWTEKTIGFHYDRHSLQTIYGEWNYEIIGNIHENPELIP